MCVHDTDALQFLCGFAGISLLLNGVSERNVSVSRPGEKKSDAGVRALHGCIFVPHHALTHTHTHMNYCVWSRLRRAQQYARRCVMQ